MKILKTQRLNNTLLNNVLNTQYNIQNKEWTLMCANEKVAIQEVRNPRAERRMWQNNLSVLQMCETISVKGVEEAVLAWGTLQTSLAHTKKIEYQIVSCEGTG